MNDFTATLKVERTPVEVLAALTSTEELAAWWAQVSGNGEAGGELAFVFGGRYEPTVMRVDEASPAGVVWTCVSCGAAPDWVGTQITFTLEQLGSSTIVFFRHGGLTPALECFSDCYSGWTHFMHSLEQYLNTGIGMPNQSEGDRARRAVDGDRVTAAAG